MIQACNTYREFSVLVKIEKNINLFSPFYVKQNLKKFLNNN